MESNMQKEELLVNQSQFFNMIKKLHPFSKEGQVPVVTIDNFGNMSKIRDIHIFGTNTNNPLYLAVRTEPLDLQLPIEDAERVEFPFETLLRTATGLDSARVKWIVHLLQSEGFFILERTILVKTQNEIRGLNKEKEKVLPLQTKLNELNEYVVSLEEQIQKQKEHIDRLLDVLSDKGIKNDT